MYLTTKNINSNFPKQRLFKWLRSTFIGVA